MTPNQFCQKLIVVNKDLKEKFFMTNREGKELSYPVPEIHPSQGNDEEYCWPSILACDDNDA